MRDAIDVAAEIDTAEVAAELRAANEKNAEIRAGQAYRALSNEHRAAEDVWNAINLRMEGRKTERAEALARAEMPVEGISIGDGEVLYKGLPFAQASAAEQIRVSMALGMASNPRLRVLRIVDGSLLDDDSLAMIGEEAGKQGFQVWIERVDTSGKVGVLMEDGEASGEEVVSK